MTGQEMFDILVAHGVTMLYHANSVSTSLSQLRLGGLSSRERVEQSGLPQKSQITDDLDRKFGIWGDVFMDTVDIHARISDRNKYGPVMFVMRVELLRNLPAGSRALITRTNPSKWDEMMPDQQRYFMRASDLTSGLNLGDFDQMLVIRTASGIIPFGHHLQSIVLDEPRLQDGESPEYNAAASALAAAANVNGVNVGVMRRQCAPCKCYKSYADRSTRVPWFYNIP